MSQNLSLRYQVRSIGFTTRQQHWIFKSFRTTTATAASTADVTATAIASATNTNMNHSAATSICGRILKVAQHLKINLPE